MARPKSMTEKVTINIDPVDLGYIDLLVDQGFYGNRSDFIKNAVKTRLHDYDDQFKEIQRKERNTASVRPMSRRTWPNTASPSSMSSAT